MAEVERGAPVRDTPVPADERFVQVLAADGQVVDSTPQVADAPVLEPALAERAAAGQTFWVEEDGLQGFEGPRASSFNPRRARTDGGGGPRGRGRRP